MTRLVYVEHLGMAGNGPTRKAAMADAARRAEGALGGDYRPRLISFRGDVALIYRTPNSFGSQWRYEIINQSCLLSVDTAGRVLAGLTSFDTLAEADRYARHHLAQNLWDGGEEVSPIIMDAKDQREFGGWARWQKCHREWTEIGASDEKAREMAGQLVFPSRRAEKP